MRAPSGKGGKTRADYTGLELLPSKFPRHKPKADLALVEQVLFEEMEHAAELLDRFDDDPWALAARPWALSSVGEALVRLAASEPNRVAAMSFELLGKVREWHLDVLEYAACLVPVLRAAGADLPAAALHELKAVQGWTGSSKRSASEIESA